MHKLILIETKRNIYLYLCASSSHKKHDSRPSVGEGDLQETHCHRQGGTSRPEGACPLWDGPGVGLDLTNHVSQVHVDVLKGLEKPNDHEPTKNFFNSVCSQTVILTCSALVVQRVGQPLGLGAAHWPLPPIPAVPASVWH